MSSEGKWGVTDRTDKSVADECPAYDPPRALRMSDMSPGGGVAQPCNLPGSGADGDCSSGSLAAEVCGASGSSADVCASNGGSASVVCSFDGSGTD